MATRDPSGVVRLLDVRDNPLSVDEVFAAVQHPGAGGVALFVGTAALMRIARRKRRG